MVSLLDRLYCQLLRFCIAYNDATAAIASVGGNTRYLRDLSREREMFKAQLDRLEVRHG